MKPRGRQRRVRSNAAAAFVVPEVEAERVLSRLRSLVEVCALEPAFLDSLMLSCYLRGVLEGQAAELAARRALRPRAGALQAVLVQGSRR